MDARVNVITLAVADLPAARRFYAEGLGWPVTFEVDGEVIFLAVSPTTLLSLWSRPAFEAEVGPAADAARSPIVLAHNVPSAADVDSAIARAVTAGGSVVHPAEHREWGGYSGYIADPEGYRWEVAWNPSPLGEALMQGPGPA